MLNRRERLISSFSDRVTMFLSWSKKKKVTTNATNSRHRVWSQSVLV